MKQFIYIIALLISSSSIAQIIQSNEETIVPLEDKSSTDALDGKYYFKDINNVLDKFIGTWKYEDENQTLEITFFKVIRDEYGGDATDMIDSNFTYTRNGTTVFNTFPMTTEDDIYIFGSYLKTLTNIRLTYSEPTSDKQWTAQLYLDYIAAANNEPEKLKWDIESFSKKMINGVRAYPYEIPYDLLLVKQ